MRMFFRLTTAVLTTAVFYATHAEAGSGNSALDHVREWQASMNTLPYLSIPWTEKRFTTIPADSPTTWSYSSQVCGEHCPWSRACASYAS